MDISNNDSAKQWLEKYWPKTRAVDVYGTMDRYDYPYNVRNYIMTSWIKINNEYGGTFCEPEYYSNLPDNHVYKINKKIKK